MGMFDSDDVWCSACYDHMESKAKIKEAFTTLINSGCFNEILENQKSKEFNALMTILIKLEFHTKDLVLQSMKFNR